MLLSKARRNDTAACTSKSFNDLEDAIGCGERNGESCGLRERRSGSVMVEENSIENQECMK